MEKTVRRSARDDGLARVTVSEVRRARPAAVSARRSVERGTRPVAAVGRPQVVPGLLHAAQREAEPELDHLPGLGRAAPHQAEGAQGGRPDPVEVQPGAAVHQPPVVPQQLAPVAGVALQVHGQRGTLDDHLGLGDAGPEALCRCARSGTVAPYGIASPPIEKSMTIRASWWAGKV